MSYLNLEHKLLEVFKKEPLSRNLIVSVSGGMDSVALLSALSSLQKQLELNLKVAYIHHGNSKCDQQLAYRNSCYDLVKTQSKAYEVPFMSNYGEKNLMPQDALTSEDDFRVYRQNLYDHWLRQFPDFKVVMGHQKNDVLENQLIQMIRGCAEKGFLSLALQNGYKLRPMIGVSKTEVIEYVKNKNLKYLDDPSNKSDLYLRNWLRNKWLPDLEEYRSGGVVRLAGSLGNIAQYLEDNSVKYDAAWSKVYNASGRYLKLGELLLQPEAMRFSIIAGYLRLNNSSNFTRNQLKEILKHLDSPQKKHTFKMLNFSWRVQGDTVQLQQI